MSIFTHIPAYTGIFAHSSIFRHNQAYSRIIQVYSGVFRTLCNPGIFKNLAYSEPHAYSERWHIQTCHIRRPVKYLLPSILLKYLTTITFFTNYNYFGNISFSRSLFYKINTLSFFNIGLIFTPWMYLFYIEKYRGPKGREM